MVSMLTTNKDRFQFLNIEQPLQIKSAENRRFVRRNATLSRNKNEARSQTARPSNNRNPNEANEEVHLYRMIGSSTDPFRAFPVKMETYMYQLFDYMKQSLSIKLFPYKNTAGFHPGQMILQFAALDARVLHSILSVTSFAVANGDKTFQVWGLDHRGRTIQLINKSLGDQVDKCSEGTVLAVAQMASVELSRTDCNAWESHMKGLSQIVNMCGGLGIFPSMWYNVSEIDFMGSYMFHHAPFFSSDDYQPSYTARSNLDVRSNSTAQSSHSLNNIARSKLSLLPETRVLGEELNSILAEMHVLNQDLQYYRRSYSNSHINHILHLRRTIEFRLFSLLHEKPPASCNIQYAYILALQIYMNRVFRTFKRGERIPSNLAARLRHALLEMKIDENGQWEQVSSLLLWISFVGGATCANGSLRTWYVTFTGYIRNRIGLRGWEKVNAVLKDRLYSTGDLAENFRKFWNDEGEDFFFGIEAEIVSPEASRLAINDSVDD